MQFTPINKTPILIALNYPHCCACGDTFANGKLVTNYPCSSIEGYTLMQFESSSLVDTRNGVTGHFYGHERKLCNMHLLIATQV